jgi:uncharacterized membrane protein YfcA
MWSPEIVALILGTFFLAGVAKGIVGFGLPVVALALLANTIGLKAAIALITVPGVTMNIWQAAAGGNFKSIVRRIWALLLAACACIWFGVGILSAADGRLVSGLLGLLLVLYASCSLARAQFTPPRAWEPWLSPLVGALSGVAYGLTGSLMVPGVIYLQALGFDRNMLVQSLGITFLLTTSALALSLAEHNLLGADLGLLSALALVPASIGMLAGQRYRHRLSEELFRKVFFWALLLAGLYMMIRVVI